MENNNPGAPRKGYQSKKTPYNSEELIILVYFLFYEKKKT